ncbi:hypothetical protein CALVIDRAFT_535298 [Calocera viscosa TUFC12733]|uniref:RING-type domain-containing protein n=1 Tax=Calocera viscosa (strain TUFC12733) TaxID=1330018 RepID=A0A167PE79_CALVF|nr:hypothetical protein CALVIDRAFT_535298 [Calocera viscosa TUFC12733]
MLVFDNCPTCFEDFTPEPERAPYSISCGHVFCLSCLASQDPKLCALCRDPFVTREARRIYPSLNLDDAHDAARVEEAVIKAIDDCHPERFDNATKLMQKWLDKGSAAHASFQSTVVRLNTYMKTMNRLSKAYGDMVQYEAVVRSLDDQKQLFDAERTTLQEDVLKERSKLEVVEKECQELHRELKRRNSEVARWKIACRDLEREMTEMKDELSDIDRMARLSKESAHNHETDALRWRKRYEQAIGEIAQIRPPTTRIPSDASTSALSFTTGYAY